MILKPLPTYMYRVDFDFSKKAHPTDFNILGANLLSVDEFSLVNRDGNVIRFRFRNDENNEVLINVLAYRALFQKEPANIVIATLDGDDNEVSRFEMGITPQDVRYDGLNYDLNVSAKIILECSYTITRIK